MSMQGKIHSGSPFAVSLAVDGQSYCAARTTPPTVAKSKMNGSSEGFRSIGRNVKEDEQEDDSDGTFSSSSSSTIYLGGALPTDIIGKYISKHFAGYGMYSAVVSNYNESTKKYECLYEDDTTEEMSYSQLVKYGVHLFKKIVERENAKEVKKELMVVADAAVVPPPSKKRKLQPPSERKSNNSIGEHIPKRLKLVKKITGKKTTTKKLIASAAVKKAEKEKKAQKAQKAQKAKRAQKERKAQKDKKAQQSKKVQKEKKAQKEKERKAQKAQKEKKRIASTSTSMGVVSKVNQIVNNFRKRTPVNRFVRYHKKKQTTHKKRDTDLQAQQRRMNGTTIDHKFHLRASIAFGKYFLCCCRCCCCFLHGFVTLSSPLSLSLSLSLIHSLSHSLTLSLTHSLSLSLPCVFHVVNDSRYVLWYRWQTICGQS